MRSIAACAALLTCAYVTGCGSSSSSGDPATDAGVDSGDTGTSAPPGYSEVIAPIIQAKCQSCHHTGGAGPFPLENYGQAKLMAKSMARAVSARTMPPWAALDDAECKHGRPFRADMSLKEDQIAAINAWADAGAPEGDPKKAPPPKTFSDDTSLPGVTDTVAPKEAYAVKGETDDLRCFVIDPKFATDTWLNGIQVQPGNKTVVHHALIFTDPSRKSLTKADASGSYKCFGGPDVPGANLLMAWAPGVEAYDFGKRAATYVPKDSLLVMQVHYHPHGGTVELDQTKIQLRKTAPPEWAAVVALLGNADEKSKNPVLLAGPNDPSTGTKFSIPAGVTNHTETMEMTLPLGYPDLRLWAVGTHMHWVGVDMKISVERNRVFGDEPESECLLGTPRYNFNWQRAYQYDSEIEKLPILRGNDKIKLKCTYNNTIANPMVVQALADEKVSSPVEVKLGEATLDEMCLGAFIIVVKNDENFKKLLAGGK